MKKRHVLVAMFLLVTIVSLVGQKIDAQIRATIEIPSSIRCCTGTSWNFILEDNAGNPLSGKPIVYTISKFPSTLMTSTTDASGIFKVSPGLVCDLELNELWTIVIEFAGDTQYNSSSFTIQFNITCSGMPTPMITPGPTPDATVPPNTLLGDVNGDGSITIVDALYVAQYYVGLIQTFAMPQNADVNRDGNVTIVDALQIARCYIGIISCSF